MFIFKWIRTVKTENWEKNIKIVWYTNTEWDIFKSSLTKYSIVILSFSEFNEKIDKKLYEVKFLDKEWNNIDLLFTIDDESPNIRAAFKYFIDNFWILDLVSIKPYWVELDENKQKIILEKLKKENWLLEEKHEKSQKHIDENNIKINKTQISEFKKDVEDFIKDARQLVDDTKDIVPTLSFELNNIINELLKYRKTTNIYKLAEIYKDALEMYEKLYNKYFDYLKEKEVKQSTNQIISDIDIIREYKNYEKVKRAQSIENVDAKQFKYPFYEVFFYKFFWKFWVDLKLLFKEYKEKYRLNYFSIDDVFNFLQFVIIFLVLNYSLLLLYNVFTWWDDASKLTIFYFILNFSLYGFILTIWKFIARKNIFVSVLIMIILFLFVYIAKKYLAF